MNWVIDNGNHNNAISFFNPKDFLLITIVPLPMKNFSCLWLLGCLRLLILWKIHIPMIIRVPTLIQKAIVISNWHNAWFWCLGLFWFFASYHSITTEFGTHFWVVPVSVGIFLGTVLEICVNPKKMLQEYQTFNLTLGDFQMILKIFPKLNDINPSD